MPIKGITPAVALFGGIAKWGTKKRNIYDRTSVSFRDRRLHPCVRAFYDVFGLMRNRGTTSHVSTLRTRRHSITPITALCCPPTPLYTQRFIKYSNSRDFAWRQDTATWVSLMKEVLIEEWDTITIEEINAEIAKLPSIMQRCLAVNGGNKYHA